MTDDESRPDRLGEGHLTGPLGLDPWLLEILACPACRAPVRVDEPASTLVCTGCGLVYPVRDGIPVMLVDEALKPGG
jgi:uncharacterized protein YbaR (Trm112 family)